MSMYSASDLLKGVIQGTSLGMVSDFRWQKLLRRRQDTEEEGVH